MKPDPEAFLASDPDVDPELFQEHFSRLPERYFQRFSCSEIRLHLAALSRISARHPVEVLLEPRGGGSTDCTVLAFDYPGVFSLMTGVFAATGFDVTSGEVFTYAPASHHPGRPVAGTGPGRSGLDPRALMRRRIVNFFSGAVATALPSQTWAGELRRNLEHVIALLERGDEASKEKANAHVNEIVVSRLGLVEAGSLPTVLYPVQMEVDNSEDRFTRLRIISENTPAFLYSLTHAFSLHGIQIEHVDIRTIGSRVEDAIDVVDANGKKIEDPDRLARIRLSALLTKQFTYFLRRAPDPYAALSRYRHLVQDILNLPSRDAWLDLLSDPHALEELARLLGASDFLWEDFIRLQYESLLPLLQDVVRDRRLSHEPAQLVATIENLLQEADSIEAKRDRLNRFKDQEIFLIDLDHILNAAAGFHELAERLTTLAELVVNKAVEIACDALVERYGRPRTAGGLESTCALLGLGKLGGAALGYASDIEFLLVYSDRGQTDGPETLSNSEFYERLVRQASHLIQAKREGIFHVDLRLRPHGEAGPLACSLEAFCDYYGRAGAAHSYERLALVRLRAIGGDRPLGDRVERIRDEILYSSSSIRLDELKELRVKQLRQKTEGGRPNAKFSPGGLVDLEYNVQILQVQYGGIHPRLRTPRIHQALAALADAGVLTPDETEGLTEAYDFFRNLINALRVLRGSASDLFLPPADSPEFGHLARRMGYGEKGALDPAQRLYLDYETHSAAVRAFADRHFGRDVLPGDPVGTVADLVLADEVPRDVSERVLASAGFRNPERAVRNIVGLAGTGPERFTFARLALLAFDILSRTPNPDMALNNWERFLRVLPSPQFHFNLLLSQPMRLEILLHLFSASQFLADTLIRYPGYLEWILDPGVLHPLRNEADLEKELNLAIEASLSQGEWLNRLRRLRCREILRIGARDILLKAATTDVMFELSVVAQEIIRAAVRQVFRRAKEERRVPAGLEEPERHFCILALGKLGGQELNYSSDVDIVAVRSDFGDSGTRQGVDPFALKDFLTWIMEKASLDLSAHTEEGYAYRVDLRLRPYGRAGDLVPSFSGLAEYYHSAASLWEVQAALKMCPIAGNLDLGRSFIESIRPLLLRPRNREEVIQSIDALRQAAVRQGSGGAEPGLNVKIGVGGIRDVEFLVQGLQLIHGPDEPRLLQANTLRALEALEDAGLLTAEVGQQLREDYLYLRRVEHCLQILEDRQTHALPREPAELEALARRLYGPGAEVSQFLQDLEACAGRVRAAYVTYLLNSVRN